MKKPKRMTKDMVLCAECKRPVHIDDLALISKEGMFHKECCFKILYQNPEGFMTRYEMRIKSAKNKDFANSGGKSGNK